MSIDYSKIYSVLSSVEGKNQQEIEKIIEEFRQIKSLKTVNQAKDFLEKNYGITNREYVEYMAKALKMTVGE